MQLLSDVMRSVRAAPWFALALLIALVAAGFNGLMVVLMALRLDALLPGPFAQMSHFTEPHHRIHDLTFAFLFLPTIVGVLAQLRRPVQNIAAMWMALLPSAGLLLTLLATSVVTSNSRVLQPPWLTVMAGVLMATALHPAGGALFGAFRISRVSWPLLALVVIAAVPLLPFAAANIGLQGTVGDEHADAGHYGFMAAFAFTVIGVGLLTSLRPEGWRLTAWVAGILPILLGAASLIYPEASSSLPALWAVGAMGWGLAYLATAEVSERAGERTARLESAYLGSTGAGAESPAGIPPRRLPRWLRLTGVIVGLLVLLAVGIAFIVAGGHGPGQHGAGGRAPARVVATDGADHNPFVGTVFSIPSSRPGPTQC